MHYFEHFLRDPRQSWVTVLYEFYVKIPLVTNYPVFVLTLAQNITHHTISASNVCFFKVPQVIRSSLLRDADKLIVLCVITRVYTSGQKIMGWWSTEMWFWHVFPSYVSQFKTLIMYDTSLQSADELQWSEKRDRQSDEARYYEDKIYRHTQNMDQGANKRLDRKGHWKCFISDVLGSLNTSVVSGC